MFPFPIINENKSNENTHVFIPHVEIFSYMIPFEMEYVCIKATFLMVFPHLIIWN